MNEITKTQLLWMTVLFAAVAALFAAGANARIPEDSGSANAAQESFQIGRHSTEATSWRGKGGKGEETEGLSGQASIVTGAGDAQAPSWRGKGGKGEE